VTDGIALDRPNAAARNAQRPARAASRRSLEVNTPSPNRNLVVTLQAASQAGCKAM